jgi:hypothetical protein
MRYLMPHYATSLPSSSDLLNLARRKRISSCRQVCALSFSNASNGKPVWSTGCYRGSHSRPIVRLLLSFFSAPWNKRTMTASPMLKRSSGSYLKQSRIVGISLLLTPQSVGYANSTHRADRHSPVSNGEDAHDGKR